MENQSPSADSRDSKREQFKQPQTSKGKSTAILVGVLLALVAVAVYLVAGGMSRGSSSSTLENTPEGEVRIALAELEGGQARFYDYKLADEGTVRFFVMKSSDGVYRAALDACDVCYHAKKGYTQQGDYMICNNCGLSFRSALINEVSGGCNPVGIPRTIAGAYLVIRTSDLESRRGYF